MSELQKGCGTKNIWNSSRKSNPKIDFLNTFLKNFKKNIKKNRNAKKNNIPKNVLKVKPKFKLCLFQFFQILYLIL